MGIIRGLIRSVLAEVKPRPPRDDGYSSGSAPAPAPVPAPYGAPGRYDAEAPPPPPQRQDSDDKPSKYKAAYEVVTRQDRRRTRSLYVTHAFAYSIIIVGIIFLVLVCTGNFPTSVENQKYLGIFVDEIVKYSLYIFCGVAGVAAVLLARSALHSGRGLGLPMAALALVILAILATMGQSIYLLTFDIGMAWWGWLLNILMLLQRLLYLIVAGLALHTLREASGDEEVRRQVAGAV